MTNYNEFKYNISYWLTREDDSLQNFMLSDQGVLMFPLFGL